MQENSSFGLNLSKLLLTEYLQDKYREKWNLIDSESIEGLTRSTASQIICTAGINMHGERIKVIDKCNTHACCPACESKESW